MRFLYFQPRTQPSSSPTWPTHYQTLISVLDNCSTPNHLNQIHTQLIRTHLFHNIFIATRLITFLTTPTPNFNITYARRIFDQIHHPNQLTWNSILRGYTQVNASKEALLFYKQMLYRGCDPDSYTYPIITKACSNVRAFGLGESVHGQVMKSGFESNMIVMCGFLGFYSGVGRVGSARKVFDEMPERDLVSWTTMISGYGRQNCKEEAFLLFDDMRRAGVEPNEVTVVSLLSACGSVDDLDRGKWIHSYVVDSKMEGDVVVGNALMNMYAKCGSMDSALEVFHNMPMVNVVSWNILIGGFTQCGSPKEALRMFGEMEKSDVKPNEITLVHAFSACAELGDLEQGKLLHAYIVENKTNDSIIIGNALINMYSKCGDLEEAACVFRGMHDRDIFSWTTLVVGYVQGNKFKEALTLFQEMQLSGVRLNHVTLASLLSACAQLGLLDQGKQIHAYIDEHMVKQDALLGTALIDMYVKCGCTTIALQIFNSLPQKDTFSWNAMIGGLAMNGYGREAIILFSQMQGEGNAIPDTVTFVNVLCACTHSGLVDEGFYFFKSMSFLYGIRPSIEHYGCMVDLLGKAGQLEDAVEFINKMPVEPNYIIWASLLSACCVRRKVEIGEIAARKILKLAPNDEGVYVLLSNLYAEARRWDDVRRVRSLMGTNGVEKSAGCSLIEVDGVVQEFHVRGLVHHDSNLIYSSLDSLMLQAKEVVFESSDYVAFSQVHNGVID
ncbi:hypothetical protein ACHQM5_002418 [Ranunculus cassubicifolius]